MIALLDQDVGRVVSLLKELGIDRNTVVVFTSDNGPHSEGGHKQSFFNSNGPFRGYKRDLLEGGIRVPMVAYWPGTIAPGSTSNHPSGFQDFLPTACQLAGVQVPDGIDGISYLPTLLGNGKQRSHEQLYWRFKEQEALRRGHWKIQRNSSDAPVSLHDLRTDAEERRNLAESHPDVTKDLVDRMNQIRFHEQADPNTPSGE